MIIILIKPNFAAPPLLFFKKRWKMTWTKYGIFHTFFFLTGSLIDYLLLIINNLPLALSLVPPTQVSSAITLR